MKIATKIPDVLHMCPGCEDVASGELYCDACRHAAEFYDKLLTRTGYRAVGETQSIEDDETIPPAPTWRELAALATYLAYVAWAAAFGWAVRFISQHWK
jgi:hypothetical protein